jgi:Flp pilus assembly protein TadG
LGDADRGSVSLEVAILGVVLLLLVLLAFAAGRTMLAANAVADAAFDAARAASLQTTASAAAAEARSAARQSLDGNGLHCVRVDADADTSGYGRPVATDASVTITVSCTLSNARLTAIPGLPAHTTLTSSATSPLDRFRARSPA